MTKDKYVKAFAAEFDDTSEESLKADTTIQGFGRERLIGGPVNHIDGRRRNGEAPDGYRITQMQYH